MNRGRGNVRQEGLGGAKLGRGRGVIAGGREDEEEERAAGGGGGGRGGPTLVGVGYGKEGWREGGGAELVF